MAHELAFTEGGEAMIAFAGDLPWHKLGTQLPANATGDEIRRAAHLDWEPALDDCYTSDMIKIDGFKAVRRSDTRKPIGIVSDKYVPVGNQSLIEFADAVVGTQGAFYHVAGALRGGADVWLLLQIPGDLVVAGSDAYKQFLLVSNNHVGKRTMRAFWTSVRCVCANTIRMAFGEAGDAGIAVRHTGEVVTRVNEARRVLGLAGEQATAMKERLDRLAAIGMTEAEIRDYVGRLFPFPEDDPADAKHPRIEKARRLVTEKIAGAGRGLDVGGIRGTRYGALQAAIEWWDHDRDTRSDESRFDGIMFGDGVGFKGRALELLSV
jgi:phage/plasmid-like protein (TIGR03299 family)